MHPLPLFRYNWKVREEYFERLAALPANELMKPRVGGFGSILRTLAHIVLVEQDWIRRMLEVVVIPHDVNAFATLGKIKQLSDETRSDVESFFSDWDAEKESKFYEEEWEGEIYRLSYPDVTAHTMVHEIHHIGQLSVWLREAGVEPPATDII